MVRLIITDDHPIVKDGLQTILAKEKDIEIVAYVSNGIDLLEMLGHITADVILMDVNMPGMNGIEATQYVKARYPNMKILCFSQYDDKRFVRQVLKRGANGYLLKNSHPDEMIRAIKTVAGGDMYLSDELPGIFEIKSKRKSKYFNSNLTARERDILNEICNEKNNHEIAETLNISHNTVESHRANILLKTGVKNVAGLVKWALMNQIV